MFEATRPDDDFDTLTLRQKWTGTAITGDPGLRGNVANQRGGYDVA